MSAHSPGTGVVDGALHNHCSTHMCMYVACIFCYSCTRGVMRTPLDEFKRLERQEISYFMNSEFCDSVNFQKLKGENCPVFSSFPLPCVMHTHCGCQISYYFLCFETHRTWYAQFTGDVATTGSPTRNKLLIINIIWNISNFYIIVSMIDCKESNTRSRSDSTGQARILEFFASQSMLFPDVHACAKRCR